MICCIIAYALCELYKETPKGEKYRKHCLMKYIEYDRKLFRMSELGCGECEELCVSKNRQV